MTGSKWGDAAELSSAAEGKDPSEEGVEDEVGPLPGPTWSRRGSLLPGQLSVHIEEKSRVCGVRLERRPSFSSAPDMDLTGDKLSPGPPNQTIGDPLADYEEEPTSN